MNRRDRNDDVTRDPRVEAELAALEAVLAGDPPTGELEAELAALVREVREETPSMPLALRERLDRSVADGFAARRRRVRLPKLTLGRMLPVLGGLAAVLIAVVVAAGQLSGGGSDSSKIDVFSQNSASPSESAAGGSASIATDEGPPELQKRPGPGAASDSAAATATPSAKVPQGSSGGTIEPYSASPSAKTQSLAQPRKVERAVDLSLRVGPGKLQDASDGVVRVTQGVGGYVQDSQVSAQGSTGSADFTLRVPTAKLDEAIAKLSKLGHVSTLNQSSKDITASFTSVGEKLSDARAERKALVSALGKAQTSGEIASLRERIRANRSELAALKGQLNRLRGKADQATILVTVESQRGVVTPGATGGWTPGDAARDALRVLEVAAGVVIVAAAALVPLGIVVLLAVLIGRSTRRRRREHALDTA